jgi:hypothetical protein
MIRILRPSTVFLALFAVLAGASLASAERVRCRSRDYKYEACRVSGRITHARVVDRHSDRPCVANRTFGWRGDTLWVDDGCDADFEVEVRGNGGGYPGSGYPGSGGYPGPDRPGPWPGNGGGGQWEDAPNWAAGNWRSTERVNGRTAYLSISRNGNVTWSGNSSLNGRWTRDGVRFNDGSYMRVREDGRRRITVEHPMLGRVDFKQR